MNYFSDIWNLYKRIKQILELKNTVPEIKITIHGLTSRFDTLAQSVKEPEGG